MMTETIDPIVEAMEPFASLPTITAHEARLKVWGPDPKKWTWTTSDYIESPLGWWQAIIGTDHGHDDKDHAPVRWYESYNREPWENVGDAFLVVDELRKRGYWIELSDASTAHEWHVTIGKGQDVAGDSVSPYLPTAICDAALAATAAPIPDRAEGRGG
jgi:hypothetical protein